MSKILVFGNYALQVGNCIAGAQVITPPAVYDLTVVQTSNGHLEAYPLSGYSGDKFGLTATPSAHYHLNTYSVTGAVLTGNSGTFTSSDVTVQANFAEDPKYTATLQTNGYGSIAANKTTGYQGDTVTLSNTPSADCTFASYAITGATLTGNQFNFGSQNVTAKANFNRNTHTVTVQNDGHGTVTASPTTGYSGTQVTLSTTPASNYEFSGYTITGATLTGNKFNIGTSNVTAKAWFKQSNPYANITGGFTYRTSAATPNGLTFDFAGGVGKDPTVKFTKYNDSYVAQGSVTKSYGAGLDTDQMYFSASGAGIWNAQLTNYKTYSAYTHFYHNWGGGSTTAALTDLITIDFMDRTKLNNEGGTACPWGSTYGTMAGDFLRPKTIPSSTYQIFNYGNVTSVAYMWRGYTCITGQIEPFISAMIALRPTLTAAASRTTGCFMGCTNASDYQTAKTKYPNWF